MRFSTTPAAIVGLVAVAFLPAAIAKPLAPIEEPVELQNELVVEKRQQCPESQICGWERKLCCPGGCTTNQAGQAECKPQAEGAATTGWVFSTALITQTGIITQTSVFSTFIGGPAPTAAASCNDANPCPNGYWCASGQCLSIGGNTPGATPGVTATGSPTATLPFGTPIPTGANGTLVESNAGGGGLSGGAIAGIVIGVILGVILLLLICFYCCARSAFHGLMAIFGLGKKRRTREETTYISEHHHSGSVAAGGGRWYGQASSRPSRPPKKSGGMGNLLGIGAGLAGLAAVLGMKRKHDRRHDDKSTTVSGSSYYYSDYTSSSSASSDDRRTRNTRHSSRR